MASDLDKAQEDIEVTGEAREPELDTDVVDDEATAAPQLVLVKPSVNVLTKGRFRLMNPNGWYCFESAVKLGTPLQLRGWASTTTTAAASPRSTRATTGGPSGSSSSS